jgi:uncharacterized membrane protein
MARFRPERAGASRRRLQRAEHIDQAVRSVGQLHSDHQERATTPQRLVDRITAFIARPFFIALFRLCVVGWIGANLMADSLGFRPIDAPAFAWLQVVIRLYSVVVMLVLVAQKHDDELNRHHDTRTLELALINERKIAKLIELVEAA